MKKMTVFTPTYNRENEIKKLYESLCMQKYKDFIWLIIDDGSTDGTAKLIETWINEKKIEIEYIKQKNGGKYKAVNTGVRNCKTDLFVFIDSDDYFLKDSLSNMIEEWKNVEENKKVAGIVGRRTDKKGNIVGKKIDINKCIINENKLIKRFGYIGDTCRMYRTEILRNYLYPEIEDKFIPEHVMLAMINNKYDIYFINKPFSVSEYLEHGYTKNYKNTLLSNPKGHWIGLNYELITKRKLTYRLSKALSYILWSWSHKIKNSFRECNNKLLYIIVFPVACILYCFNIPKWYNYERKTIFDKIFIHLKIYYYLIKSFRGSDANILSAEETVNKAIKERKNIIRFGDGEFNFFRKLGVSYQSYDPNIEKDLNNIINSYNENSNYILSMPKDFFCCSGWEFIKNRKYLLSWAFARYYFINKIDSKGKIYGDAFVFARQNEKIYKKLFNLDDIEKYIIIHNDVKYKEVFEKKYNKVNVEFIQIPDKNAYKELEKIFGKIIDKIKDNKNNSMIIISAGPAGKILVDKLGKKGIWAIDTGHCFDFPLNIMNKGEESGKK